MKGYFRQPEATAEALRDGWFHTGDIGVIDADGYLLIVDRKKDMILRGGFNVYPREVEDVLLTHPAVSPAPSSACRRAARRGRQGVRRPQGRRDVDRGRAHRLVPREMAVYKAPRSVQFIDALPMSATGKVLKRELRAAPAVVAR